MVSNSPHPFERIRREQQMLAILCILDGECGPTANDEVMSLYLAHLGIACARRDLQERFTVLAAAGLVRADRRGSLMVVELTGTGSEVARGVVRHEGVAVPMADCPYRWSGRDA